MTRTSEVEPSGHDSRRLVVPLLVAAAVVAADQLTKRWALSALDDPRRTIDLVGSLRFNLVFNTGSAFSAGEGLGVWIALLALVVVVVLAATVRHVPDLRTSIPLAMVGGGAVGNLVDRAFRGDGFFDGAVVDFVDLQWWPVFNLADAAIVVGGALLLLFARRAGP